MIGVPDPYRGQAAKAFVTLRRARARSLWTSCARSWQTGSGGTSCRRRSRSATRCRARRSASSPSASSSRRSGPVRGRPPEERSEADGRGRHRLHRAHRHRQGAARRVQQHAWRGARRACDPPRRRARRHRARRGRGCGDGLRAAGRRDGRQHRAPGRAARGVAGEHVGDDDQPLLLLGPAGDRARGGAHHERGRADRGGGRARIDQPRAVQPEHASLPRRVARRSTSRKSICR